MKALLIIWSTLFLWATSLSAETADETLKRIDTQRGIVTLLGLPADSPDFVTQLAEASELQFYFQSSDALQTLAVRQSAEKASLLGSRVFAATGAAESIHLGANLADAVLVYEETSDAELLRVLRPRASAWIGERELVKPVPEGLMSGPILTMGLIITLTRRIPSQRASFAPNSSMCPSSARCRNRP